jgi:hypothetical protein
MSRPKSKEELVNQNADIYKNLLAVVEGMSKEEFHADLYPEKLYKNTRDVLAHLHHWHLMMERWYTEGMKGIKPAIPGLGYTWKTTPDLNVEIKKKYESESPEKMLKQFKETAQRMFKLIEGHSNEELFEKKRYKWTNTTSMGAYFISATSSHHEWAVKFLKKGLKGLR